MSELVDTQVPSDEPKDQSGETAELAEVSHNLTSISSQSAGEIIDSLNNPEYTNMVRRNIARVVEQTLKSIDQGLSRDEAIKALEEGLGNPSTT